MSCAAMFPTNRGSASETYWVMPETLSTVNILKVTHTEAASGDAACSLLLPRSLV